MLVHNKGVRELTVIFTLHVWMPCIARLIINIPMGTHCVPHVMLYDNIYFYGESLWLLSLKLDSQPYAITALKIHLDTWSTVSTYYQRVVPFVQCITVMQMPFYALHSQAQAVVSLMQRTITISRIVCLLTCQNLGGRNNIWIQQAVTFSFYLESNTLTDYHVQHWSLLNWRNFRFRCGSVAVAVI